MQERKLNEESFLLRRSNLSKANPSRRKKNDTLKAQGECCCFSSALEWARFAHLQSKDASF
jgi:hypothetical protein